jgi:hypothetical protein
MFLFCKNYLSPTKDPPDKNQVELILEYYANIQENVE